MAGLLRPPGPKSRGIMGNFPMGSKDPLGTFTEWAHTYGDIFHYRFLNRHVYFLNHPDLIKEVLVTRAADFRKGDAVRVNRRIFGNGLLASEGAPWLRQRRMIQPAFHHSRIESYGATMVQYTQRMVETWRAGEIRDAHQDMMKLTLEIVCRALFDIEIGPDQDRIAVALSTLMQLSTGGRMLLPQLLRRFPTASNQRYERANLELDDVVFRLIRSRQGAQGTGGNDLLTALLQARYDDGSAMTEQQLRDEVMTLLLAGHETTAVTLSWIWLLVSQHPEVERQLLREIDCVLGTRSVAAQDISQLRVTESVVKEAMRLYPPAWALVRTAANKVEIGGYTVPAGSSVVMSQWVMHRDPRFYEEPERFRPERWLNESSTPLPRFAYFPFGGGPRICIGAAFAMTEAVLVLATVAQRWKLRLEPGWAPAPVPGITLRPRGGIKVRVEPRS